MNLRVESSERRHGGDRGVAVPIVALSIVVLLAFAAIVIDLGNGRQEKRHIQNAIDAAALAGAMKYDPDDQVGTELAAMDEAMHYLRRNQVNAPNASDGVYEYHCTGDQSCDISLDPRVGAQCLGVQITNFRVGTHFAGVIGSDEILVKASANGCVEPGPPGDPTVTPGPEVPAGWAGGKCSGGDPGFDTSGNFNRFEGGIRASDNPKDGSGNAQWTGARSYRGNIVQVGALWANNPPPAPVQVGAELASGATDWPPGFGPAALPIGLYASGGDRALAYHQFWSTSSSSTFSLAGRAPGVYYLTSKDVTITGSPTLATTKTAQIYIDPATGLPAKPVANGGTGVVETRTLTGITLVHAGRGKLVRGSDNLDLKAFELELNRLVIFSNSDSEKTNTTEWCVNPVVEFGGKCNHVDGVIYTPRGAISNNGNANGQSFNPGHGETCSHSHADWRGGMIGHGLKLAGNANLYRSGPGSLVSTPGPPGPDDHYLQE